MVGFSKKGVWRWWAGCLAGAEGEHDGGGSLRVHPASLHEFMATPGNVSWSRGFGPLWEHDAVT